MRVGVAVGVGGRCVGVAEGIGDGWGRLGVCAARGAGVAWLGRSGKLVAVMVAVMAGRVISDAGSSTRLHACTRIMETQARTRLFRTDGVYHKNPGDIKIKLTPCEYVLTPDPFYEFTGKIAQYPTMEM